LRSLIPPPYLTVSGDPDTPARTRRGLIAGLTALILTLAVCSAARAATTFYIRGGGDGHGIGMSQYGAYGYALHGADYQAILAHYYQGTSLGTTSPDRTVRVLLGTGATSFAGATSAGRTALGAGTTYRVTAAGSAVRLTTAAGKAVGTFAAPLTVSGPAPLTVPGHGTYRGSLVFSPSAGGIQTVNAVPGGGRPHIRHHRQRRRGRLRPL
jgi:stage II sporulation protein D